MLPTIAVLVTTLPAPSAESALEVVSSITVDTN